MNYHAHLILRERLRQGLSQKDLCRGICAVSYLSKIESGKAEPSGEIVRLLMERLGIAPNPGAQEAARALAERGMELLLSFRRQELRALLDAQDTAPFLHTASGLEIELLLAASRDTGPLDRALEPCMDQRQLALQRILQGREQEAVKLFPCADTFLALGTAAYVHGDSMAATEALQAAYQEASALGAPHAMLRARLLMGNSCSNRGDLEGMARHYQAARRLAEALGDQESLLTIGYNTASSWIEAGRYEEAYGWFADLPEPGLMALHKLAICCEKTGRKKEALQALEKAESAGLSPTSGIDPQLARSLCALVRCRLERPDYLSDEAYGSLLLDCFGRMREELPLGYAIFHLPWVLEWYKATRQYKKACELLEEFPRI